MILVDTGPLVALIHQDDNEHSICKETFLTFSEPLGTVWPVLTEAMYLLSFSWVAQNALWEMTQAGAVEILSLGTEDRKSTRLNSSHSQISYAVFCLKKKKTAEISAKSPAHPLTSRMWLLESHSCPSRLPSA